MYVRTYYNNTLYVYVRRAHLYTIQSKSQVQLNYSFPFVWKINSIGPHATSEKWIDLQKRKRNSVFLSAL